MRVTGDRDFDWVAGLSLAAGAVVLMPSLLAMIVGLIVALIEMM